jgi:hypothetical protein
LVMEWLEVKDVSFQPIKDLRIDSEEWFLYTIKIMI